jgi:hypothetical protein
MIEQHIDINLARVEGHFWLSERHAIYALRRSQLSSNFFGKGVEHTTMPLSCIRMDFLGIISDNGSELGYTHVYRQYKFHASRGYKDAQGGERNGPQSVW